MGCAVFCSFAENSCSVVRCSPFSAAMVVSLPGVWPAQARVLLTPPYRDACSVRAALFSNMRSSESFHVEYEYLLKT